MWKANKRLKHVLLTMQGWTMDTFDEKSKATIEKMLQEEQYPF